MKKLTFTLVSLLFVSQFSYAQWTNGADIYNTNTGSVTIGASTSAAINASAALFPSITPKFTVVTGQGPTAYTDLVTLRHPGADSDAVQRQIGFALKLSSEGTSGESDKMGGMILESSNRYGNIPSFSLVTANARRLTIDYYGNVGVNTINTKGYKLAVNGSAIATSMTVKLNPNWPDYVFNKDYQLLSLAEVKTYIDQNQHLPEMPSEQEIAKWGLNLGEMNRLLVKKVEELTLYLIEQNKRIEKLESQLPKTHE
jgi:hypothetical protein